MKFTDDQLDFFRKDLEANFAYSKLIDTVKDEFKKQGRDFDKEFADWKKQEANKMVGG